MRKLGDILRAGIAAITIALPASDRAAGSEICPMFLVRSCVINEAGLRHTAWTNPCLAKKKGLRFLHRGAC